MSAQAHKRTVAVDFDGVIHSYTSPWTTPEDVPDPPVKGAFEWLVEASRQFQVVIYSTRASTGEGVNAIHEWLEEHGLPHDVATRIHITCRKPPAVMYIDDRGYQFEGTFPSMRAIREFQPWNRRSNDTVSFDKTRR